MASNNEGTAQKNAPPCISEKLKNQVSQKVNFRWLSVSFFVFSCSYLVLFPCFFLILFSVPVPSKSIYSPTTEKIAQFFVRWQWGPKINMKGGWRDRRYMVIPTLKKMRKRKRCIMGTIVLPEGLIQKPLSSIMEAVFSFCCASKMRNLSRKKRGS